MEHLLDVRILSFVLLRGKMHSLKELLTLLLSLRVRPISPQIGPKPSILPLHLKSAFDHPTFEGVTPTTCSSKEMGLPTLRKNAQNREVWRSEGKWDGPLVLV